MKRIASIKAPSSQGITIAHIIHDDRQTGEYLLQDDFSAQGVWFNPNRSLENFASILSQNRAKVTYYVSMQIL